MPKPRRDFILISAIKERDVALCLACLASPDAKECINWDMPGTERENPLISALTTDSTKTHRPVNPHIIAALLAVEGLNLGAMKELDENMTARHLLLRYAEKITSRLLDLMHYLPNEREARLQGAMRLEIDALSRIVRFAKKIQREAAPCQLSALTTRSHTSLLPFANRRVLPLMPLNKDACSNSL